MIGAGRMTHGKSEGELSGFTITGMQLRKDDVRDNNVQILATFDYEDGTYEFRGCALMRMGSSGSIRVSLPRLWRTRDVVSHLTITDRDKLFDLGELAKRKYMDMGGDPEIILNPEPFPCSRARAAR